MSRARPRSPPATGSSVWRERRLVGDHRPPRADHDAAKLGAGTSDRTLVVVELGGGNDGLNTVVPIADPALPRAAADARRDRRRSLSTAPSASHPQLAKLATRYRAGRSRSSRASATRTPTSRTSRRSRTGGRARRGRRPAPAGSAATSTPPSGSTTRSPASGSGRCRRPRWSGTRSFATTHRRRRPASSRGRPRGSTRADDLVEAWAQFAPATPDPSTLMGQVQRAIGAHRARARHSDARPGRCTPRSGGCRPPNRRRAYSKDGTRRRRRALDARRPARRGDDPPRVDLRERPRRLRHPPGPRPSATRPARRPRRRHRRVLHHARRARARPTGRCVMTVSEFGRRPARERQRHRPRHRRPRTSSSAPG